MGAVIAVAVFAIDNAAGLFDPTKKLPVAFRFVHRGVTE